jgi:signal transduction histidine kinase/ligand-binding sensor domain-containing protein
MRFNLSPKKKLALLLLALVVIVSPKANAQTHELKFKAISGVDGLNVGKINGMVRDIHGVMWLSDQSNRCITRYDGLHMKRFPSDPKNPNSLGGSYPECLATDSTGIIWIGFYGMGLDRFNPETGEFTHYRHQLNDPRSLSSDTVSAVLVDRKGNVWIGTNQGLDLLDQETGTFTHFMHNPSDPTSLSYNLVRVLYEDRQGTLWVGCGFPFTRNNLGGLNRFNSVDKNFKRFMNDPADPSSIIHNKVRAIFEDSKENFWVGTAGDGLHTLDRATGVFTRHTYNKSQPSKLSRPAVVSEVDHITFITEDVQGQIWIGSFANGMNRYNPVTGKVTYYGNDIIGAQDPGYWWISSSNDGLLLISSQGSTLYQVELFQNTLQKIDLGAYGYVNGFLKRENILWIATDSGLVKKNLVNQQVKLIKPKQVTLTSQYWVNNMQALPSGNILFHSEAGINEFNPETETVVRLINQKTTPGFTGAYISNYLTSADSSLWIGTFDQGLFRLDHKQEQIAHYSHTQDTTSILTNPVVSMVEYRPSDLWITTWDGGGVNRLNSKSGIFKHYLVGLNVFGLTLDHKKDLLAMSLDGIYSFKSEEDRFVKLSAQVGNPYFMQEDRKHFLWVGAYSGLYRVNPESGTTIYFGKDNGILSEALSGHPLLVPDGQILIGTINGYYSFHPDSLITTPQVPKIQLSEFWLGNELVTSNNGLFKGHINMTNEIKLAHHQNIFSFGFSIVDYSGADYKHALYQLEGYDLNWREPGSGNQVYYFNVPPGKYTLMVKATNSANGEWQEKSIVITIAPPWWRTWWAYGSFAVILVGFGYAVHKVQRNRVIQAERERTREKELAQAKEIEKAYTELKTTQAQLVQSEKMASLGELTAGIAHEIQNPLNFVNNFSEINSELLAEMTAELERGDITSARQLASDIDENEKKIVFHGKRADAIVKSMLQHSRSNSGQKEQVNLNALCDEYLRLSYHGLRAKDKSFNAKFETNFDDSITEVNLVRQDFGRVILNLINNAFYAVNERSKQELQTSLSGRQVGNFQPLVSVSTKNHQNKVEIKVFDNGGGIPEALRQKIFQPFFTTKPAGQGTGLGLSLSYDIITKGHSGEIKVESNENVGTTFTIVLPNNP